MVAPKENSLSLGQIVMERHSFKTLRVETQKQKASHLRQHCQDMQDGVRRAQQHNRQLLQQFQEAEDTLREMITLTAAMKTTRMEYEHLLGISQWRQQLQDSTQERRNLNGTGDQPLPSRHSSDGSFHSPHVASSWMRQDRNPLHPQDSSPAPPHVPSHPVQLLHQASGLSLHRSLPYQNGPDLAWFWPAAAAGTPSGPEGRFCTAGPPAESGEQSQTSSAPGSCRRSAGSRGSRSAQELDTHPVRLPCSAESSDSTTESGQLSREKTGRSKRTSSEGERRSSPHSEAFSVARMGVKAARSPGSVASSEESTCTRKGSGPEGGLPEVEDGVRGRNDKREADSHSSRGESRHGQTDGEDSGSQRESPGSVDLKRKNEYLSGTSEEVKGDEGLKEDAPEVGDEEAESDEPDERDEEEQERKEDSERHNPSDEEEDAGAEEEMEEQGSEEEGSGGLKGKDKRKLDSASSQGEADEDEGEESEDLSEEDEASDKDNTQDSSCDEEEDEMEEAEEKGDEAAEGEESDSDECIIPQQKSKPLHVIPEEAAEDEDEEETQPGSSGGDSEEFSDDVEDLLEPQKPPKTQETMKPEQEPKGFRARMEIFQVETDEGSSHRDLPTDSDEFDHFFD